MLFFSSEGRGGTEGGVDCRFFSRFYFLVACATIVPSRICLLVFLFLFSSVMHWICIYIATTHVRLELYLPALRHAPESCRYNCTYLTRGKDTSLRQDEEGAQGEQWGESEQVERSA